ncbi:MAG TPA: alternative ribosome rescue aminoacyl-tRNA hydrolase ArfB, partial [Anaerolineales bacterium]|nr:alternative ribosome rescue aminoacyl-tRNA hydrolase ArfB [Anaerolineales bacterium]
GGQNVNKVATAVQLRFNVRASRSLGPDVQERLIRLAASHITADGDLVIDARKFRSQGRNRQDALERLARLVEQASILPKSRKKTKSTLASKTRRLAKKRRLSQAKQLRRKAHPSED